MDWVKPKKERMKRGAEAVLHDALNPSLKNKLSSSDLKASKSAIAATAWLEQICQENVAYLQRSLPLVSESGKRRRRQASVRRVASSILWGSSALETEIGEASEVLDRVIQAYAEQPLLEASATDPKVKAADELRMKTCENIARWIIRSLPVHGEDPFVALVSVAWIHGLRELGSKLSPSVWLEVLQSILTQVERAWSQPAPDQLLPWLLWSCEAPLALATQISHLGGKDRMVTETLDRLALLLETSCDDPTLWIKPGGRNLRALLASTVRIRWAANSLGARSWYAPQRKAIAKLTKIALSLTQANGQALLLDETSSKDERELWLALIEICAPNKSLDSLYAAVFSDARRGKSFDAVKSKLKKPSKAKVATTRLPEPGKYFEKAELATMRRNWEQDSFRIAVDYSRDPMGIDCVGEEGVRLLSGDWDLTIHKDGELLETDIGWSDVCWFSDDDVDYLEIESAVEGRCRIQRQMMLIRQTGLMFFSDTLLADENARWTLESAWDLAPGIEVQAMEKTHEVELVRSDKKRDRCGLVLPLGLPEWRRQIARGKLTGERGKLVLRQEVDGNRLYCPLVLSSRRVTRRPPYTWRHLTVAQDLKIQPAHIAQAYRVQIGKEQVVFYRSLAKTVRRTAMGLHLNSEFYAGRFDSDDATFESIVEINADEE